MVIRWVMVVAVFAGIEASTPGRVLATERREAPAGLFVEADRLTSAGEVVSEWAKRARFHGLDTSRQPPPPPPSGAAANTLHDQLVWLVAELPARPREVAILKDPDVPYYASPDQTWRTALPPTATPEAIEQALAAARDGRLAEHLDSLLPTHPQYRRLVSAAERYASLCESGLPDVPRPPAKRGEPRRAKFKTPTGDYAIALEKRLAVEGFLAGRSQVRTEEARRFDGRGR